METGNSGSPEKSGVPNFQSENKTGMDVQGFLNDVEEANNSFANDRKKVNLKELTYNPKAGSLPEEGEEIRIVLPLVEGMKAFQKLDLHWNIGPSKLVVCPKQYGRPCHICDHVDKLKATKITGDYTPEVYQKKVDAISEKAKKMEARTRYFLPIVVRGKEEEGPKWWGFPKTVLNLISGIFKNKYYGDISDIYTGQDLTITFPKDADTANVAPIPIKTPLMSKEDGTADEEKITKLRELVQPLEEVFIELPSDAINKILVKALPEQQEGASSQDTAQQS